MIERDFLRVVRVRDETTGEIKPMIRNSPLTKIAIRGYVFAFELKDRKSDATEKNISDLAHSFMHHSRRFPKEAHIHGIFIPGQGYVRTLAYQDSQTVYTIENPLSSFKWSLLQELATVKRIPLNWTPNIKRYAGMTSKWSKPE